MKKIVILHKKEHFKRYKSFKEDFYQKNNVVIYAFTFEIRNYLKNKNIEYKIQEHYISEDNALELDDLALNFALNWHKDLFLFKGISLGSIIQRKSFYDWCENFRNLHVIINLIKRENPTEIIVFDDIDLYFNKFNAIIENVCSIKNVKLKIIPIDDPSLIKTKFLEKIHNKQSTSLIDFIGKSEQFRIFMKLFFKIIWILKQMKKLIFKRLKKKNILFYGYRYNISIIKKLLQQRKYNLILLDERPDLLKNRDILSKIIGKKGETHIFFELFDSKKIIKQTNRYFERYVEKWKKIIQEPRFKNFFVYNGINFWKMFKIEFYDIIIYVFKDIMKNILISYEILKNRKYDLIIFDTDSRDRTRVFSLIASKINIPTLVVQHGLIGRPLGDIPFISKKYVLWGEIFKEVHKKYGLDPNKIIITGAPRFDEYSFLNQKQKLKQKIKEDVYKKLKIEKEKKLVVFVAIHNDFYKQSNSADLDHLEIEKMHNMIFQLANSLPNIHLIFKRRIMDEFKDITCEIYDKMGLKNMSIIADFNIRDLIVACDCLISGYSTTILEAILLEKPVILLNFRRSVETIPLQEDIVHKVSDFEGLIKKVKETLNTQISIQNHDAFLEEFFYKNDGQSIKRVLNVIEDLLSNQ